MTLERAQSRIWCSKIGWQTVPCSWPIDGEAALTNSKSLSSFHSKLLLKLCLHMTILFHCDSRPFHIFVQCPSSCLTKRHYNQFMMMMSCVRVGHHNQFMMMMMSCVRVVLRHHNQFMMMTSCVRVSVWTSSSWYFTFWISLLLSAITKHTHRPQGVNYRGYLHALKYLLLLLSNTMEY